MTSLEGRMAVADPTHRTAPQARSRVLIVDDSHEMRGFLTILLRSLFDDCAEASDGQDALRAIDEGLVPSLICTDLDMHPMGGLEFLNRLRSRPGLKRVPVLVLSSESGPEVEAAVREAGADRFLSKGDLRVSCFRRMASELLAAGRP